MQRDLGTFDDSVLTENDYIRMQDTGSTVAYFLKCTGNSEAIKIIVFEPEIVLLPVLVGQMLKHRAEVTEFIVKEKIRKSIGL